MKKTLLLFFITGLIQLHAQTFEFVAITLDFENGADSIIQYSTDSSYSTHWQKGTPSKTVFDSSYSADHAMVTDTLNPYLPNTLTWFQVPFVPNVYLPFNEAVCPLNICFQHKMQMNGTHSGGWMELVDNDQTFNFSEFETGFNSFTGNNYLYFQSNVFSGYSYTDSLFNGEPGFHVNIPNWTQTCYSFFWLGAGLERSFDTLYFRFNFASDTSLTTADGWMIDDIQIGKGYGSCGGGINDELDKLVNIFPNPADDYFILNSRYEFTQGKLEIANLLGEIQLSKDLEFDESIFVSLAQLNPGAYFVRLNLDGKYTTKKIFVR